MLGENTFIPKEPPINELPIAMNGEMLRLRCGAQIH